MGCKLAMEGLVLCLAISVQVLVAEASLHRWPPALYVLGDSILDVGNNNYLPGAGVARPNRPYYGIDFPGRIPTGRFSNGFNTADYIARKMGLVLSPPPFLLLAPNSFSLLPAALTTGVNYASGGAGILDSTHAGDCIPLSRQVEYFRATRAKMVAAVGSRATNARLFKSIFLISAGSNDLFVSPDAQQQSDAAAALVADLISNYSAIITDLYNMGARKLAIINLELLGCVPKERVTNLTGACADGLNQLAVGFDGALRSLLAGLASRLPGLVYSIGNYFRLTKDIFADPQAFGYTDITGACCGSGRLLAEEDCLSNSTVCYNRDQHFFWDRIHPSQQTAFLTAQAFYDGPDQYTTPINFMQLAWSS